MCRYAQFYAFISVIELPRIPAYRPKERGIRMNIVFSSDKKEYNTIKKGTEILLAENDGFNQNI